MSKILNWIIFSYLNILIFLKLIYLYYPLNDLNFYFYKNTICDFKHKTVIFSIKFYFELVFIFIFSNFSSLFIFKFLYIVYLENN